MGREGGEGRGGPREGLRREVSQRYFNSKDSKLLVQCYTHFSAHISVVSSVTKQVIVSVGVVLRRWICTL